jgi:hypothetical protein
VTLTSDRRARTDRRGGVTLFEAAGSLLLLAAIVAAGCFASLDLAAGDAVPAHAARRARAQAVSRASFGGPLVELHLQRGGDVDRGALLAADLSTPDPTATVDVTVAAELASRTPARGAKSSR